MKGSLLILLLGAFFIVPVTSFADEIWEVDTFLEQDGTTKVDILVTSDEPLSSWEFWSAKVNASSVALLDRQGAPIDLQYHKSFPYLSLTFADTHEFRLQYSIPTSVRDFGNSDEWVVDLFPDTLTRDVLISSLNISFYGEPMEPAIPRVYIANGITNETTEAIGSEQITSSHYFIDNLEILAGKKAMAVARLPKGFITFLPDGFIIKYGYLILAAFLISPLGLLWVLFSRWLRLGRDPVMESGVDFKSLPLGMVGLVKDEYVGHKDIYANLVHMAQRGVIHFSKVKGEWTIILKKKKTLLPFEKVLLKELFGTKKSVKLSDSPGVYPVMHQMYEDSADERYFDHNPHSIRFFYYFLGGLMVLVGYIGILFVYGFPLFLLGLVLLVFGTFMPQKTIRGVGVYRFAKSKRRIVVRLNFMGGLALCLLVRT